MRRVVSISTGKDSTLTGALAIERHPGEVVLVTADTDNEHEEYYRYLDYLRQLWGLPIAAVKADFADRIHAKREYVREKWPLKGVPQDVIDRALSVLYPTGNAFLDLCLWKGRFPSRRAQFCTEQLKKIPLNRWMMDRLVEGPLESWQGVRADESEARKNLAERQDAAEGWTIVRPILRLTTAEVFQGLKDRGIKPNPLYSQGMGRVGCMPCVNCAKGELREIARRFPQYIELKREWEEIVSLASKRGSATFFPVAKYAPDVARASVLGRLRINPQDHGIRMAVEWANTEHGGRQFGLFPDEPEKCENSYGLCE